MSRNAKLAEHLRNVPLFSKCAPRDLATVAKHIETLTYEPGAKIVAQGEHGDSFYVLLDGTAVVRRNGRRIRELAAGDYFGELAVLDPVAPQRRRRGQHTDHRRRASASVRSAQCSSPPRKSTSASSKDSPAACETATATPSNDRAPAARET